MKITKILFSCFFAALLLFGYSNCAKPLESESNPYAILASGVSTLTLTPAAPSINWGSTIQFFVSGGKEPYSYSILDGSGALNPTTGLFVAPSYNQTSVIQVMDADGNIAQTQVNVYFASNGSLTLNYSPASIHIGDTVTLSASGGTAPYTYSLLSGAGSVSGNLYFAASGGANIAVRDANGTQSIFYISVDTSLVLSTQVIYRLQYGSGKFHLFSTSSSEGVSGGWVLEGGAFRVLSAATIGTATLTRCYISTTGVHFLTNTGYCNGYTTEYNLGYVYSYAATNTLELYSCFNNTTGDFISTTNYSECVSNGYSYSSSLGYVPQ